MQGKRPQHVVRLALVINRCHQAGVETTNGLGDGMGAPLGPLPRQPGTLAQALGQLLQFAQCLGLDRLDFQPVLQHPLQLALAAPQGPDGRRVLQPHHPLLEGFGRGGRLPQLFSGLECQGHAVNRLPRPFAQQVGGVERPQLMFEVGLPAFENDFPGVRLSAQGILGFLRVTPIGVCLIRFHKNCHSYGRKKNLPVSGSLAFRCRH